VANNLPSITSQLAPDLRRFLDRVREFFSTEIVTKEELINSGAFSKNSDNSLTYQGGLDSCISPPAPFNLSAAGAMTAIILTWEGGQYGSCFAYTEVWRSTVNDIGQAVLIGTASGAMFADSVGSDGQYYYWVRNINTAGDEGSFNSTTGTLGSTSPDLSYLMAMLSDEYGVTSAAPFFQLDQTQIINGVAIPAGTYIDTAFIYDAAITNAKIGNLAVDSAKIADAAVVTAKINDAAITTAKIGTGQITTALIKDAAITNAKIYDAAITTAKIADAAITNAKIKDLSAEKITAGFIDADRIQSASITGDKIKTTGGLFTVDTSGSITAVNATVNSLDLVGTDNFSVKTSTTGARIEMTSRAIKVYDGARLRVQIGDLTA